MSEYFILEFFPILSPISIRLKRVHFFLSRETQRQGLVLLYDMTGMNWTNSDIKLARELLEILKVRSSD
jgi:hypothetical protein